MNHRKRALLLVVIPALILVLAGFFIYKSQPFSEAQLLLDKATVLLEKEDAKSAAEALPLLNRATAMAPNMGDAYVARSYAHFLLKQPEKAAADGSKAISLNPNDAWAHINYGVALLNMKQDEPALQAFKRAVALEPENTSAYYNLAIAYDRLGMDLPALQAHDKTIELNPNWAIAHLSKGDTLYNQGKYALAFRSFSAAIRFGSGSVVTKSYELRGLASAKNGDFEKAIADYNIAILLAPQKPKNFYNRGLAYKKLKNYRLALRDHNTALGLNPQYALAYGDRGLVWKELKQYSKALKDLGTAIRLQPKESRHYYNRGNTYLKLKQGENALQDFNKTISLEPQNARNYYGRARVYTVSKQWQHSIADFTKALQLDPNYDDARLSRVWAYYKLGNAAAAENDCNFLIRKKRGLSGAYAYRGLTRILQFRDAEASKDFAIARKLAKTDDIKMSPTAWKAMEKSAAEAKIRRGKLRS